MARGRSPLLLKRRHGNGSRRIRSARLFCHGGADRCHHQCDQNARPGGGRSAPPLRAGDGTPAENEGAGDPVGTGPKKLTASLQPSALSEKWTFLLIAEG